MKKRNVVGAGSAKMAIVTADDVTSLCFVCVRLRSVWIHYQALFGIDIPSRDHLGVAPTFFEDVHYALMMFLIVFVCSITDTEEAIGGKKNLSLKFILQNSDFSQNPHDLTEVTRLSDRIHTFRQKLVPARNKLMSHLDLETMRQGKPLGGVPPSEWNEFWLDLQDLLYILHKHYVDKNGNFYLNAVGQLSDAQQLIQALKTT